MSPAVVNERRAYPRGRLSVFKKALYSTLRAISKHVKGFYGALAAFVTVSLVVGAAASAVFLLFAGIVTGGFTQRFDEVVLQFFERHRTETLDLVMLEVTALGSGVVLLMIVTVASIFLWISKHHWSVYILLMGVFGGQLVNRLLKTSFDRPRPTIVEMATDVHSLSFPSGHAMTSMIAYGSVAYLVGRLEPTRRMRIFTWVLAALIILVIGISRMYLGVHYPSDILAGYLGGIAVLAFVASSVTALRFFSPRRPETRAEEHDLNLGAPQATTQ